MGRGINERQPGFPVEDCIGCHLHRENHDHLFSSLKRLVFCRRRFSNHPSSQLTGTCLEESASKTQLKNPVEKSFWGCPGKITYLG